MLKLENDLEYYVATSNNSLIHYQTIQLDESGEKILALYKRLSE